MFGWKKRRRRKLRARPFPEAWCEILRRNVPYFSDLDDEDQRELLGHIQVFLAEKPFEGCGGLEITDEIRVTIAAQACILLLHRETDYYPKLRTILVYPHPYVVRGQRRDEAGFVVEREEVRLGESWTHGAVVLAWDSVKKGAADPGDGQNVVFHEFAHQLDAESGATEGAPVLEHRALYGPWARILGREYARLIEDLEEHRQTFLSTYGAVNPAEFFAVVTEAFFEQPRALRRRHPELYEQLAGFYRQDPASRG